MKYYGYITYVQKIIFLNVQNKCWILFFSPQIQNIWCNVPFQNKNVKSTNYKGKIYNCVTYQSLVKLFRNKGRKLWRSQDTSFMIAPPEILWILVPISPRYRKMRKIFEDYFSNYIYFFHYLSSYILVRELEWIFFSKSFSPLDTL